MQRGHPIDIRNIAYLRHIHDSEPHDVRGGPVGERRGGNRQGDPTANGGARSE